MSPTLAHSLRVFAYGLAGTIAMAIVQFVVDQIHSGAIPVSAAYAGLVLTVLSTILAALHAQFPGTPASPSKPPAVNE